MRHIPAVVLMLVAVGACSEEPPAQVGSDAVPAMTGPSEATLLSGVFIAPDGDGCTYAAGFDGRSQASIGRYCSGGARAQWSTTYGTYEARRADPTSKGYPAAFVATFTVTQSPCLAVGTTLALDGVADVSALALSDGSVSRNLSAVPKAQLPTLLGATNPASGCFAPDGTFTQQ